jgi:hypothetical protein
MSPDQYRARLRRQILRNSIRDASGCWLWTATRQANGYGATRLLGKVTPAHRAAFVAFKGPIEDGTEIMHTCDVRHCVNPDHLQAGTHAINMREMSERGRSRNGITANTYFPTRDPRGRFSGAST